MRFYKPFYLICAYFLIVLIQFVASMDGIMHFFGLHWIFTVFVALLLAIIPAIGPLAGVYGAVVVWHWPVWTALLLFFWPYLIYGYFFFKGIPVSVFLKKQKKNSPPDEIEISYKVIHKDDRF